MELKPNFDVLEFLSHQPHFTQNYSMKAAELSAETAKSVIRYADNPVVTGPYQNSVHTHVNQVAYDCLRIMNIMSGRDYADIQNTELPGFYTQLLVGIVFHDDGEKPFKEWQTARGETDPKIKEALKNYDIAAMEARTGLTNIRVSLLAAHEGNPRIYTDFVAQCRDALDVKKQYEGGSPSAEKILLFNEKAMKILDEKEAELSKHRKWNDGALLSQFDFAKQHYLDIETSRTALGAFGKVTEKVEGSIYVQRVNNIKRSVGGPLVWRVPGYEHVRMAGRYEGYLAPLWNLSEKESGQYDLFAAGLSVVSFKTSQDMLLASKKYITLNPRDHEPKPDAPDNDHIQWRDQLAAEYAVHGDQADVRDAEKVANFYKNAIDASLNGSIPVPQKGESLYMTQNPAIKTPSGLKPAMLENILRVF